MALEPHALMMRGEFVEVRMVDPADVPAHKLDVDGGKMLRPFIAVAEPTHEPTLEAATVAVQITPENVTQVWTVTRRSLEVQHAAVKTECGRRIYASFPQWKQANLTARAAELINLKIINGTLTPEETIEFAALQSMWDWIKAVRAASDAIEAMNPIPTDYMENAYWPAEWGT